MFSYLLHTKNNLIVYGDKSLKSFVKGHRPYSNTVFVEQSIDELINKRWFSKQLESVRQQFINEGLTHNFLLDRLRELIALPWEPDVFRNPQFTLYEYNQIQMSKTYMVEEAYLYHDIWGSDYINWFDAGGIHIFSDIVSDKGRQQAEKFQLLFQQPMFAFSFSGPHHLYFGSWERNGTSEYIDK